MVQFKKIFKKNLHKSITCAIMVSLGIHFCANASLVEANAQTNNVYAIISNNEMDAVLTDSINLNTGILPGDDNKYHLMIDGVVDTSVTGLYNWNGTWIYLEEGTWIQDKYAFVDYNGGSFLVANGIVASMSGLVLYDGVWYFLADGQLQNTYTGLAEYDGEWFYVINGILAEDFNGIQDYDGSKFLIAAGRILYSHSGLYQDFDGTWYFIANGQVQTQYTGLALYDGEWFYIRSGVLAVDYTGWVEYDGAAFQIINGMVVAGNGADSDLEQDKNESVLFNKYTDTVSWSPDNYDTIYICGEGIQLPCKYSVLQDFGVIPRYGATLPETLEPGKTKTISFEISDEEKADIIERYWANVIIINNTDAELALGECIVYNIDLEIMDLYWERTKYVDESDSNYAVVRYSNKFLADNGFKMDFSSEKAYGENYGYRVELYTRDGYVKGIGLDYNINNLPVLEYVSGALNEQEIFDSIYNWHLQEPKELTLETVTFDANWYEYIILDGEKYNYGIPVMELPYYGFDTKSLEVVVSVPMNIGHKKALQQEGDTELEFKLYSAYVEDSKYFGEKLLDGFWMEAPYATQHSNAGDGVTTFGIGSTYAEVKAILGEPTEIESSFGGATGGVNWVVGDRKLSVTFGQDVNEDYTIPADTNPDTYLLSHIYMH